jgi:hypothetical protein
MLRTYSKPSWTRPAGVESAAGRRPRGPADAAAAERRRGRAGARAASPTRPQCGGAPRWQKICPGPLRHPPKASGVVCAAADTDAAHDAVDGQVGRRWREILRTYSKPSWTRPAGVESAAGRRPRGPADAAAAERRRGRAGARAASPTRPQCGGAPRWQKICPGPLRHPPKASGVVCAAARRPSRAAVEHRHRHGPAESLMRLRNTRTVRLLAPPPPGAGASARRRCAATGRIISMRCTLRACRAALSGPTRERARTLWAAGAPSARGHSERMLRGKAPAQRRQGFSAAPPTAAPPRAERSRGRAAAPRLVTLRRAAAPWRPSSAPKVRRGRVTV